MRLVALALLVVSSCLIIGCSKEGEPEATVDPAASGAADPANGSEIGIMTSGAGGMAPVTGTENIQGSGAVPGQAAKDSARNAAAAAGSSSIDQLNTDGE